MSENKELYPYEEGQSASHGQPREEFGPEPDGQDELQDFFRDLSSLDDYQSSPETTASSDPEIKQWIKEPEPTSPTVSSFPLPTTDESLNSTFPIPPSGSDTKDITDDPFFDRSRRSKFRWLGWSLIGLLAVLSGMFSVNYFQQQKEHLPLYSVKSAGIAIVEQIKSAVTKVLNGLKNTLDGFGKLIANEPVPWLTEKIKQAKPPVLEKKPVIKTKSVSRSKPKKTAKSKQIVAVKPVQAVKSKFPSPHTSYPKPSPPLVVKSPKIPPSAPLPLVPIKPKTAKKKITFEDILPSPVEEVVEQTEEEIFDELFPTEERSPYDKPKDIAVKRTTPFVQASPIQSPFSFILPEKNMPFGKYIIHTATCFTEQCLKNFALVLKNLDQQPFFRTEIKTKQILEVLSLTVFPSQEQARNIADFVNQNSSGLSSQARAVRKNNEWYVSLGQYSELREAQNIRTMTNRVAATEATFQIQVGSLAQKTYQVIIGPFSNRIIAENTIQELKTQNTKFSNAVISIR